MVPGSDTNDRLVSSQEGVVSWVGMFRSYPSDLAGVCIAAILAAIGVSVLPAGSTVRMLVVAPLAFFLPGYVVVSLLLTFSTDSALPRELGLVTKLALAFGTSLAVVPLAIVTIGTTVPLTVMTILETLVLFTLVVAQMAAFRRIRQPTNNEYRQSDQPGIQQLISHLTNRTSLTGKITGLLLVGAVVVAISAAGLGLAHPPSENEFTNFHLATENDDGELETAGFPTNITSGSSVSLVSVVANHEGDQENYSVVVQLQRVQDSSVVERSELARFSNTIAVGEQWRHQHEVTPNMTGENLRLTYLLYKDGVPDQPTVSNAADQLYLWVDISDTTDAG